MKHLLIAWMIGILPLPAAVGCVLCIGEDGHWTFELANEGECVPLPQPETAADCEGLLIVTGSAAECCGSCVDIALPTDILSIMRAASVRSTADAPVTLCRIDESVPQTDCRDFGEPGSLAPSRETALSLKTVVLRT